jgi:hypothetical protein
MPDTHIHLNLIKVEEKEACETTMYGNIETLSSLVYSAMLSNPKFAEIVMNAAYTYAGRTSREAMLN